MRTITVMCMWMTWATGCGRPASAQGPKPLLENDKVRVSEVTLAPGEKLPSHQHPDFVIYVLSGGELTGTPAGGSPQKMTLERGQAIFSPAVTHAVENTGTTPLKLLVVEMLQPSTKAPPGEDSVKIAPDMHRLVLDHERVRVTEVTFAPKQFLPNHVHPDHVVYLATDTNVKLIPAAGGPGKVVVEKAGKALFVPATHHANENLADQPAMVVIFELR
jgi:beta-alanine degradation protein BauB